MSGLPDPDAFLVDRVFDPPSSWICDRRGGITCLDLAVHTARAGIVVSLALLAVCVWLATIAPGFLDRIFLLCAGLRFVGAHREMAREVAPWARRARDGEILFTAPPFRLTWRFLRVSEMLLLVVVLPLIVDALARCVATGVFGVGHLLVVSMVAALLLETCARYLASCRVRPASRAGGRSRVPAGATAGAGA